MGLIVSDGKSRAQRRAEAKALKTKAKLEAKLDAKARRKAEKIDRRAQRKAERKAKRQAERDAQRQADRDAQRAETKIKHSEDKASVKVAKASERAAKASAKADLAKSKAEAESRKLSTTNVKRYLAVARMVAPIAAPVIYRAAVGAREQLAVAKANRAGVSPDVLRKFAGHGATLSARIATTRASVEKVATQDQSAEGTAFTNAMNARLANLATAVDAAEMMPPAQRRNAHQAIDRELSAIEGDILARLGVRT
ncbi:hypothetical protein GOEFS_015_00080 [Gordonia effusa NBRC 100432]|uniref:Uncharacterized protein n=1 Tax=Gordonia effusa NBRC 100432 TaxID=1077974 RepID=H0QVK5_9ACTN|nr:DUF6474 family protein [Gordonia effusa]GAB16811.1 hypothetical protein GOEFS_015_00080 [Gordonia effusa NBRC 100432]